VARFKLLSPHTFATTKGPAFYETGTELDSSEVVDFHCTALMQALDAEAQTMIADECQRLRAEAKDNGSVIGFGATSTLPA